MRDYHKVFLKAAFNSLLSEFMDSDTMDLNKTVSPEFIGAMRKVADYYYGSPETTAKRIKAAEASGDEETAKLLRAGRVNYDMVTTMFKGSSFFKNFEYEGPSTDIKLILGRFYFKRNEETGEYRNPDGSYDVRDVYDFSDNAEYVKEYGADVADVLLDMGVSQETIRSLFDNAGVQLALGAKQSIQKMTLHPIGRMYGGIFMSDKEKPEEGSSQWVNLHIPAEDAVAFERPAPRPLWFEDDSMEPVFPNTPMDEERKALFDSVMSEFGDFMITPAEAAPVDDNTLSTPSMPKAQMELPKPKPKVEMALPASRSSMLAARQEQQLTMSLDDGAA